MRTGVAQLIMGSALVNQWLASTSSVQVQPTTSKVAGAARTMSYRARHNPTNDHCFFVEALGPGGTINRSDSSTVEWAILNDKEDDNALVEVAEQTFHPSACEPSKCISGRDGRAELCELQLYLANSRAWRMARSLGRGWRPRVHQNLGWHAHAVSKNGLYQVSLDTASTAGIEPSPLFYAGFRRIGKAIAQGTTALRALNNMRDVFQVEHEAALRARDAIEKEVKASQ